MQSKEFSRLHDSQYEGFSIPVRAGQFDASLAQDKHAARILAFHKDQSSLWIRSDVRHPFESGKGLLREIRTRRAENTADRGIGDRQPIRSDRMGMKIRYSGVNRREIRTC